MYPWLLVYLVGPPGVSVATGVSVDYSCVRDYWVSVATGVSVETVCCGARSAGGEDFHGSERVGATGIIPTR